MVRVLEEVEAAGARAGASRCITTAGRLFLYPQLEERGFVHETDEPGPGLVRIRNLGEAPAHEHRRHAPDAAPR